MLPGAQRRKVGEALFHLLPQQRLFSSLQLKNVDDCAGSIATGLIFFLQSRFQGLDA